MRLSVEADRVEGAPWKNEEKRAKADCDAKAWPSFAYFFLAMSM